MTRSMTGVLALLLAVLLAVLPAVLPARAEIVEGAEPGIGPDESARAVALLSRTLPNPEAARYGRLRPGRHGAICGEVDTTNRMGQFTGPRHFVADLASGVAGRVPDGPELRNPATPDDYAAMQRILTLHAANCAG